MTGDPPLPRPHRLRCRAAGRHVRRRVDVPARMPMRGMSVKRGKGTRRAAEVEWMQPESAADLRELEELLTEHGLEVIRFADWLAVIDGGRISMTPSLGQWLTYAPETREFAVYDGGADRPADHDEVGVSGG